jgi:hypothetical protein
MTPFDPLAFDQLPFDQSLVDEGRPAGLKQREEEVHGLSDVGVHRERNIYGAQGPNPGAGG